MAFIAARMSVLRGRPVTPWGSAAPAAPTLHPVDRSDILPPPADTSGGAPPSTLPFAITVNPVTVNHAIHRDANTLLSQVLSEPRRAPPHSTARGRSAIQHSAPRLPGQL